ncbi:MAG: hypothetical protein IPH31_07535 [Lewinellaceae bacterium]|jgi:putative transposase|nr:hypothetical protein [Lewinellaceae bacterium]
MNFEANTVYHIYNQGNNRQPVFFTQDNYLFFLRKMRKHLLPYADLLCYCLMPNHFHWLVYVNSEGADLSKTSQNSGGATSSRTPTPVPGYLPRQNLNHAIGTLLSSYTRAINIQENRTGSLFRKETKSKNGWIDEFITVDRYRKGSFDFRAFPDNDYGIQCFRYILENPVKAGLVNRATDWQYSSAMDFAGLRPGTLCNQKLARDLLLLP